MHSLCILYYQPGRLGINPASLSAPMVVPNSAPPEAVGGEGGATGDGGAGIQNEEDD